MWVQNYDWSHDSAGTEDSPGMRAVCAEWFGERDGPHYVEVFFPVDPVDPYRLQPASDEVHAVSIETWGAVPTGST